jgi:hypothetical protein
MTITWNYYKRKAARRKPKDSILIVCEGKQTEPNYFRSFNISGVRVLGEGLNTVTCVQRAIAEHKGASSYGYKFDQVWCVFDKDSFEETQFKEALSLAKDSGVKVAYSNEAFELWYLLHFDLISAPMPRGGYQKKLSEKLGIPYKKNDKNMYDKLLKLQPTAIKNAKKLLEIRPYGDPAKDNPSTTVHLLVEELNKLQRK